MDESLVALPAKVAPTIKARVEADAAKLKRTVSGHVRHILDEHFAGTSVEQVREELGDVTLEVARLRERFDLAELDASRDAAESLRQEVRELRELVAELTAGVHHTSSAFMEQLSFLDRSKFDEHFRRLLARYKRSDHD